LTLAENGASVVIHGTNTTLLNELTVQIEDLEQKCIVKSGDVADPDVVMEAAKAATDSLGRISIF
jgi:3-oxoacyl-[acyl-carrier protein] reductase